MSIHTMPVPHGLTIEQAWMFHCAGIPMEATYGEGWVNVEVDDETHAITHVYTDAEELAARKERMRGRHG